MVTKKPVRKDQFKKYDIWVIGTGPSIKDIDLEVLAGKVTIGVNTFIKVFTPMYLCISDSTVLERLEEEDLHKSTLITTKELSQLDPDHSVELLGKRVKDHKKMQSFDPDFRKTDWGMTVTIDLAIPLAVYLGAGRIILLGQDGTFGHDFDRKRKHWEHIKKLCDQAGVSVVNCTKGTQITTFPVESMEDYL